MGTLRPIACSGHRRVTRAALMHPNAGRPIPKSELISGETFCTETVDPVGLGRTGFPGWIGLTGYGILAVSFFTDLWIAGW
jgi:hypothetical protein